MIQIYKGDRAGRCTKDQLETMKSAGWTTSKEVVKEKEAIITPQKHKGRTPTNTATDDKTGEKFYSYDKGKTWYNTKGKRRQ